MPLYEFVCPTCGERIELLCRMGDDGATQRCPACGQVGLERRLSAFATHGGDKGCGSGGSSGGSGCGGPSGFS